MIEWKEEQSDVDILDFDSFDFIKYKFNKNIILPYLENDFRIFCVEKEWHHMWEYGATSENELGGLLLGNVFLYKKKYIRVIDQILYNQDYHHSKTHLILNSSLWQNANQFLFDSQGKQIKTVLGWFHTHPNFLPFFSTTDRKTQEIFDFPFSIGIVFNPISKTYTIYEKKESILYEKSIILIS